MEALDGHNSRKGGIHSIINRESLDRINTDRSYTSAPTMAATAVASPASMYSNAPPPPYSGWSAPSSYATSGLVSPPESRRTSDHKNEPPSIQTAQPHRQSLPSIHEALGPKPNGPYAPPPAPASLPPQHHISYSQSQATSIPRSYPPSDHAPYPTQIAPSQIRQSSPPQPVHPPSNPFARPEPPASAFSEPPRHPSLTSLQNGHYSHNSYAAPRYEAPRFEQESRVPPESLTNGYTHHPPPQQHGSYVYGPGASHAPEAHSPAHKQPRDRDPRDPREMDASYKAPKEDEPLRYHVHLKRNFQVWEHDNYLSSIYVSSGALQTWAKHFSLIAQEQQPSDPNGVPDRMPDLETINEMLHNQEKIRHDLERLRDLVSQQQEHSAMRDQRMREHGGKGPGYFDDGMSMYDDDMKSQGYGGPESKKRRGRAAPPGRCHSCNRAETPEWRRGPDGARTLCNACGLHYAKLTRKNTMKQSQGSNGSSLRPKSMDDISPRPL